MSSNQAPESLKQLADLGLPLAVGIAQTYMNAPDDQRAEHLRGIHVAARGIMKLCLDVGPFIGKHMTQATIYQGVSKAFLDGYRDVAAKADLDERNTAALLDAVSQGFEEARLLPP